MIIRVSLEEPCPPEAALGSVCPHVQIASCQSGGGSHHAGQCSPVELVLLAPAGPQQLAHDGEGKRVCCSGEGEDAEEG